MEAFKMTTREAMIETILRAFEARAKGDIEALMSTFHPNATFELVGDRATTQIAGLTEGHSNLRATLVSLIDAFEFRKRDIVETVVEGDRAVIHSRVTVRFVPKDTVFQTDLLDAFRFQDGKIIQLVEFADTALVNRVVIG
jgi:ketosteroid isomerase-like protein